MMAKTIIFIADNDDVGEVYASALRSLCFSSLLSVQITFRGTIMSRRVDTSRWSHDKVDWLEEGYAGSFPVRPSQFKEIIMANPDGFLEVQKDGTMVLHDTWGDGKEIARDKMAIDLAHYQSGIHLYE